MKSLSRLGGVLEASGWLVLAYVPSVMTVFYTQSFVWPAVTYVGLCSVAIVSLAPRIRSRKALVWVAVPLGLVGIFSLIFSLFTGVVGMLVGVFMVGVPICLFRLHRFVFGHPRSVASGAASRGTSQKFAVGPYVRARLQWVPPEEGGRNTNALPHVDENPYLPRLSFPGEPPSQWGAWVRRAVEQSDGSWLVELGFLFGHCPYDRLVPGAEFGLYEGACCVARGVVCSSIENAADD